MFKWSIQSIGHRPAISVLSNQAIYTFNLVESIKRVISREPLIHRKKTSNIHVVKTSMTSCKAYILQPNCNSTLTLSQNDLVHQLDLVYCSTNPEPFFATIELIPSLKHFLKRVPHKNNNVFHSYLFFVI